MKIIRIFTDVSPDDVNRIVGAIKVDGGTFVKRPEPDGEFTIEATFPGQEPEPTAAVATASARGFKWMDIARGEIGVKEIPGSGSNPRIDEYAATTTLAAEDDSVPWCSSFVNWCIVQSKVPGGGTNSAQARSWASWGVETPTLEPGVIVVLKRGSPPKGHVGFFVAMDGNQVKLLGGNQSNSVNIASFDAGRIIAKRLPAGQS